VDGESEDARRWMAQLCCGHVRPPQFEKGQRDPWSHVT
jgi:hypothetical protein